MYTHTLPSISLSLDSNFVWDVKDFCVEETFTRWEQHIGEFNETFPDLTIDF